MTCIKTNKHLVQWFTHLVNVEMGITTSHIYPKMEYISWCQISQFCPKNMRINIPFFKFNGLYTANIPQSISSIYVVCHFHRLKLGED